MSRVMRAAWLAMMPRKRTRASGSSRAGPCSVSTKPRRDASGVRSSWLALATKSARIWASLSCSVRSRNVISSRGRPRTSRPLGRREIVAEIRRSTGMRSLELNDDRLRGRERPLDRRRQIGVARHVAQGLAGADLREELTHEARCDA